MTLDDPETAICSNFLGISRDFADLRGNNGKTNDDRPVLSATHTGSFLGLDSLGVSTSGWGSGLVGIECANAQNSYWELLGGYQETNSGGVVRNLGL